MRRCHGCMREYRKEFDVCPHCGYIVDTAPKIKSHLAGGTILAERYMLGRVLGHGGFGITYIAWDKKLNRTVAIKEFFPNALSTRSEGETQVSCYDDKASRFFRDGVKKMLDEGTRLSKFTDNENIVNVYDCFEENNTAYIVMEYLDGEDLKKYIEEKGGKLSPEEAVEKILPVLNALEDMHKEKLIHRDISPDNIFLCKNGKIKLLDFGSARLAIEDSDKSLSVMVKRGYAPKEQYMSRSKQGPWTDVYAVCATLYKMITGVLPTESTERDEEPLKKLSEFGINNPELEKVIAKGLEVDIGDRIQSIAQLRDGLTKSVQKKPAPIAETPKMPAEAPKVVAETPQKAHTPVAATPEKTAKQINPDTAKKSSFKIKPKAIIAVVAAVAIIVGSIFGIKAIKARVDIKHTGETSATTENNPETEENLNGSGNEVSEETISKAYEAYAAYIAPMSGKDEEGNNCISEAYVVDLDKNKIPEIIFTYYGSFNMYILSYGVNDGLSVISPVLHSSTPAEVYFSEDSGILYYTDSGHNQGTAWYHEGVCLKATSEGFETAGTVSGDAWDDVTSDIWQDNELFTETDKQYDKAFEESMKDLVGDGRYTDFFDVCENDDAEKYLEEKLSVDFAKKKAEYTRFKETAVSAIGEEPLSILVDDYDRNGTYEAFAVVGEKKEESENLRNGQVWFVSDKGQAEAVSEEYDYLWIDEKLECQYNVYYQVYIAGSGWVPSVLWKVSGSECEEITIFNDNGVEAFEKKSVNGHSNSIVASFSMYDSFLTDIEDLGSGAGHTHKPHFYYDTPDGIREYGGIEITKAQLKSLGGSYFVDLIESNNCTLHSIFARENGIINVNYYKKVEDNNYICNYINLKMTSNGVYALDYELETAPTPLTFEDIEYDEGLYIGASVPELATYPDDNMFVSAENSKQTQSVSDDAWKEAYLEVLRNTERDLEYAFWLGYVDNNDIPELFISDGGAHFCGVDVYTYCNGKAVLLCHDGEFGSIGYIERQGYLCGQYEGMGERMCNVYEVKNGLAEMIYSTYDNSNSTDKEIERTINEKAVTEEEMQNFYDEFYGDAISGFGEEHGVIGYEPTEENYKKYITDFNG